MTVAPLQSQKMQPFHFPFFLSAQFVLSQIPHVWKIPPFYLLAQSLAPVGLSATILKDVIKNKISYISFQTKSIFLLRVSKQAGLPQRIEVFWPRICRAKRTSGISPGGGEERRERERGVSVPAFSGRTELSIGL